MKCASRPCRGTCDSSIWDQTPNDTKPSGEVSAREWWIDKYPHSKGYYCAFTSGNQGLNDIHVIEYAAYDKLRRERDAYAKAMALALREGIFANKAGLKRELEKLLADAGSVE